MSTADQRAGHKSACGAQLGRILAAWCPRGKNTTVRKLATELATAPSVITRPAGALFDPADHPNPAQNQIMADQTIAELPARLGW